MINFSELELIVPDEDYRFSFVGIKKKENKLIFHLPRGFSDELPQLKTFEVRRNLFFLFYRVFNTFRKVCVEKGYLEEDSKLVAQDRDGVIRNSSGSKIKLDEEKSENIFYSKLDLIGQLLNAYDEPKILALAYRLGRTEALKYDQIHRYLHEAVYFEDGAAYVDQMISPRCIVQFDPTDIVAMYCYLFEEVQQQLEESVAVEISALAERFRQHYVGDAYSLFVEEYYKQTLDLLKDALETIHHNTPLKDADYWQYHEAIELFLYGNWHDKSKDGKIWGVENFHSVWESICLTYLAKSEKPENLLYIDEQFISNELIQRISQAPKALDLSEDVFKLDRFKLGRKPLRPDAVVLSSWIENTKKDRESFPNLEKPYKICLARTSEEANPKFDKDKLWFDQKGCDNPKYYASFLGILSDQQANRKLKARIACLVTQDDGSVDPFHNENMFDFLKACEVYEVVKPNQIEYLLVDKPLPQDFYSFWEPSENLAVDEFQKMRVFRHLFYYALCERCDSWGKFEYLLTEFGIDQSWRVDNIFTTSLLRKDAIPANEHYSFDELHKMFDRFVENVDSDPELRTLFQKQVESDKLPISTSVRHESIEVIDVKYKNLEYYQDGNNIEEIKVRDVRKQFVYEYLLQKELKELNESSRSFEGSIYSSFWLPSGHKEPLSKKENSPFIGGYITLTHMSFLSLAQDYIS